MAKTKRTIRPKYALILNGNDAAIYDSKGSAVSGTPKGAVAVIDLAQLSNVIDIKDAKLGVSELLQLIETNPSSILKHTDTSLRASGIPGKDDQGQSSVLTQIITGLELEQLSHTLQSRHFTAVSFEHGLLTAYRISDHTGQPTLLIQAGPRENVLVACHGDTFFVLKSSVINSTEGQLEAIAKGYSDALELLPVLSADGADQYHICLVGNSEFHQVLHQEFENSGIPTSILTESQLATAAFAGSGITLEKVRTKSSTTYPSWLPIAVGLVAGLLPYAAVAMQNAAIQRDIEQMKSYLTSVQPQLQEHEQLKTNIAQINSVQLAAEAISKNRVNWNKTYDKLLSKLPQDSGKYTLLLQTLSADAGLAPISTTDKNGLPIAVPPPPPQPTFQLTASAAQRSDATRALEALEHGYQMDMKSLRQQEKRWVLDTSLVDSDSLVSVSGTPPTPMSSTSTVQNKTEPTSSGTGSAPEPGGSKQPSPNQSSDAVPTFTPVTPPTSETTP